MDHSNKEKSATQTKIDEQKTSKFSPPTIRELGSFDGQTLATLSNCCNAS